MFGLLRGRKKDAETAPPREPAPITLRVAGASPTAIPSTEFPFADIVKNVDGFAIPDWNAVYQWLETLPGDELPVRAWTAAEHAWLLHLRDSLGVAYHLDETDGSAVLSTLDARHARLTLEFMDRTRRRIEHILEGIAQVSQWGRDLLIVFDDPDVYYRYAASYFPEEEGEFALSSGMHLNGPCSHYITTKSELRTVEPVIAHEMTHGCLAHLPIPLWLNEGLAVNTEHRIVPAGMPLFTPAEMQSKHSRFWGDEELRQFWSGESFSRADDGNMLSYDLARMLVDHLSADWHAFSAFVNAAQRDDGGAGAALAHLNIDLHQTVAAWLTS